MDKRTTLLRDYKNGEARLDRGFINRAEERKALRQRKAKTVKNNK